MGQVYGGQTPRTKPGGPVYSRRKRPEGQEVPTEIKSVIKALVNKYRDRGVPDSPRSAYPGGARVPSPTEFRDTDVVSVTPSC